MKAVVPLLPLASATGSIQYGYTATSSRETAGPKYLRITDIQNRTVDWSGVPHCEIGDPEFRRYRLKEGDIVFARSGATVGKSFLIKDPIPDSVFASYLIRVRCDDRKLCPQYAYYFFQSPAFWRQITAGSSGTGQPNFNGTKLGALEIPVPPLSEQRRIVAKLDSLSGRSNGAREDLRHIPKLVERYKQAILKSVYTEAESAATRLTNLGAVTEEVRNGVSRKPENTPPGIPVLKISAVRAMTVRMDERRYYVPERGEDVARYGLRAGDLLFTRYNGNPDLVANCGMIRFLDEQLIYPDKLIRVRVNHQLVDPEFVEALCASPQARIALAPFIKSAAGQHGISGADLKQLPIPLPSRKQQQQIVTKIRRCFSTIDGVVEESSHAASLLDRLDEATFAKAFRGELVAHDLSGQPEAIGVAARNDDRPDARSRTISDARSLRLKSAPDARSVRLSAN